MSDTHQWSVQILGTEVIGDIIEAESIYYTGPFTEGTTQTIAEVKFTNIGDIQGWVHYELVEYPGEANEAVLDTGSYDIAPGATVIKVSDVTIPLDITTWPLGVKVWGDTETKPTFPAMRLLGDMDILPGVVIGAGVLIGTYAFLKMINR